MTLSVISISIFWNVSKTSNYDHFSLINEGRDCKHSILRYWKKIENIKVPEIYFHVLLCMRIKKKVSCFILMLCIFSLSYLCRSKCKEEKSHLKNELSSCRHWIEDLLLRNRMLIIKISCWKKIFDDLLYFNCIILDGSLAANLLGLGYSRILVQIPGLKISSRIKSKI